MGRQHPNHRGGRRAHKEREDLAKESITKSKKSFNQRIAENPDWKPRDPRRGRSERSLMEHRHKYLAPGGSFDRGQQHWLQKTETMIEGDTYPTNFLPFTRSAVNVVAIVGQEYPGELGDLPVFCEDNCKVVLISSPPPTAEDKSLSGPGGLGKWLEKCLRPHILAAFEELGPPSFDIGRFPEVRYGPAEAQRSVSPALHLGVWERYTSKPIIMGDSRQIDVPVDKREKLVDAVHDLCGVVKAYWLPKIRAIVEWYYPGQEWVWEAMHARILKHLGRDLAKYPNFDLGGMITTLAVKEGGSEKMYVDWFDNMNMFGSRPSVILRGVTFVHRSSVDGRLASRDAESSLLFLGIVVCSRGPCASCNGIYLGRNYFGGRNFEGIFFVREILPAKLRERILGVRLHHGKDKVKALSFNFHVPKDTVDVGDEAQYLEKHGLFSLPLHTANATNWTRSRASRAAPGIDLEGDWAPTFGAERGSVDLPIRICAVPGLLGEFHIQIYSVLPDITCVLYDSATPLARPWPPLVLKRELSGLGEYALGSHISRSRANGSVAIDLAFWKPELRPTPSSCAIPRFLCAFLHILGNSIYFLRERFLAWVFFDRGFRYRIFAVTVFEFGFFFFKRDY
ncbi:hypothetical protein DFH08DRAFT_942971 [Mycena albidolilacea]|uniref:Uncharacterized protein n=1 Tax=Mycena albidolilacea TaxID=1033008 RepID=A0AAD7EEU3_9AGAR|nr:hypothetical protein DFH08DRAFT_942971 [Mycena albidolilacea]